MKYILLNNSKQCVNEICQVYIIIEKERFYQKKYTKTATWKLVPGPFMFLKNQAQPL